VFYGFPNEGLVQFRFEYLIGELQLSNDLIGKVFNFYFRHTNLSNYGLRMTNYEWKAFHS
jgi:hypothetical protein